MALNIDADDNALDFEIAKSVGEFFQLTDSEMEIIITEVKKAVSSWKVIAQDLVSY